MAVVSSIVAGFAYIGGFVAGTLGLSFGASILLGQVVGYIGAGLVLNAVARKLANRGRPSLPSSDVKANIKQSDSFRRIFFGRMLAGGVNAYFDVKGSQLLQVFLLSHRRIDGFEDFYIDGYRVKNLAEGSGLRNVLDAKWRKGGKDVGYVYIRVATRDGSGMGGNYAHLQNLDSRWTEDHRLQNQATFLVAAWSTEPEDFSRVYPRGEATSYQWVFRGQRIWRQSTGTTEWTDNAARVIGHYLQHPDGFRLARSEINWDTVDTLATWCDLPIPQNDGGTQANMRLWGYWTLDEEPYSVLERMYMSSHIRPYEMQDGRIGLMGGPFGTPACTITTKDISEIEVSSAVRERDGYNTLNVRYLSPNHKYEIVDAEPFRDEDRLALEGPITEEYNAEHAPNLSQAKRLAKKQFFKDNSQRVTIRTNMVGLKARWPRYKGQRHTILLDYRPNDGSGREIVGEYEVEDHVVDIEALECTIALIKADRDAEAWEPSEEGEPPSPLPDETTNPPPPLSATTAVRIINVTSGQKQAYLDTTAVEIPDRPDLQLAARYRNVNDSEWTDMVAIGLKASSGVLEDGETYEVQARWVGVFDGTDDWKPQGTFTIEVDQTPPGNPTEVDATDGGDYNVILFWTNPETDFYRIEVYRRTSGTGLGTLLGLVGGSSGQSSNFTDQNPPLDTPITYTVRAINSSGVPGDPVSAAPITIET